MIFLLKYYIIITLLYARFEADLYQAHCQQYPDKQSPHKFLMQLFYVKISYKPNDYSDSYHICYFIKDIHTATLSPSLNE